MQIIIYFDYALSLSAPSIHLIEAPHTPTFAETTMSNQPGCDTDATEIERSAFNAAFYELGLRWHWDSDTYDVLAAEACERARVRRYLEGEQAHLLRAYDADFLTDAILSAKRRCQQLLSRCSARSVPRFNWADARWGEVGI
jgi:hypothetical protein